MKIDRLNASEPLLDGNDLVEETQKPWQRATVTLAKLLSPLLKNVRPFFPFLSRPNTIKRKRQIEFNAR